MNKAKAILKGLFKTEKPMKVVMRRQTLKSNSKTDPYSKIFKKSLPEDPIAK